ncbi:MAG: ornithine carbamoyltransferase [Spirochaetota bacterium]|nr:ornithine carbamoyltransferase [Spirochaetota bacterium]
MNIPYIKTKDLLSITDLTREEIFNIFELSQKLKKDLKSGITQYYLKDKTLAMIFEKSSTRTRVSFEVGIFQLGGYALYLNRNDLQLGRGETISDTAKVLSRYVNGIMIRAFSHEMVERLAKNSQVPVINGLTDKFHPCQSLTDFFTIYEKEKNYKNIKLAYIGDGNNVAHSLLLGASILGIDISIASPEEFSPDAQIVKRALALSTETGVNIEVTSNIQEAVREANFIYTDVWISMGQEDEEENRKRIFADYRIDNDLLKRCAPNCLVMHCLPAHRGEEIHTEVIDSNRSIVFDQAENRLHVQKAILTSLMTKGE